MVISRFRHTQSSASRPDKHFLNINPTGAIWDCSNMIACNDRFVAVPWAQLGSTVVLRHTDYGKIPANPPILSGQEGPIIDVAFNPFDSTKLFTASEDGTIMGWNIPEEGFTHNCTDNIVHLQGHSKKVGILSFHPSASNILASAGADLVINVWDVNCNKAGEVIKCHNEQIMSLDWNLNGSLLCSTSKDRKVNIVDPRKGSIVSSGDAHQGGKTQRCVWAKRLNLIMTVGFSKTQTRQTMVWDARNMSSPVQTEDIDQSSSIMLPFFDEDTNIFYIGSRGEGNIRFYECMDGQLINCAGYTSSEVHKGLCMFPKWTLDTRHCEIGRFYALTAKTLYTIQMLLPRRQADVELQTDVYPPTFADTPAMTAEEYFNGENKEPLLTDMHTVFDSHKGDTHSISFMSPAKDKHVDATPAKVKSVSATPAKSLYGTPTPSKVKKTDATPSKYADPIKMDHSSSPQGNKKEKDTVETKTQLAALMSDLERQQEEVKQCREKLQEKERCVMETISKINKIASSMSS